MGSANSTVHRASSEGRTDEEVMSLVMPLYFTKEPLTDAERSGAVAVWKMIINDRCEYFKKIKAEHEAKSTEKYPHDNCMELFYFTFYTRMFDVHPIAKTLFHRAISKQGTFFVRFISMALEQIDSEEKWYKTFKNLTDIHNKMGVKSVEYGIMGEVFLYAVRTCVGPELYTETVHNGWAKIYSKMLDTIIPLAVSFELDHKGMAEAVIEKRFREQSVAATTVSSAPSVAISKL